jgi:hypothetical protein
LPDGPSRIRTDGCQAKVSGNLILYKPGPDRCLTIEYLDKGIQVFSFINPGQVRPDQLGQVKFLPLQSLPDFMQ